MRLLLAVLMSVVLVGCVDLPTEVRFLHCLVEGEIAPDPTCTSIEFGDTDDDEEEPEE